MIVSPEALEAACLESWDTLVAKDDPLRMWAQTTKKSPELTDPHQKRVRAILETDFDVERSVEVATDGKYTVESLFKKSKEFHLNLVEFLKKWKARYHAP